MLLILITFMLSKPIARKHFQKKKLHIDKLFQLSNISVHGKEIKAFLRKLSHKSLFKTFV